MASQDSFQESLPPTSLLVALTREQLEALPWALAKVDRTGSFTYGNRALRTILGVQSVDGKTLEDFFAGQDLARVRKHLDSRSTGVADEYEAYFQKPSDNLRVHVRISAMPDLDEHGNVVGSIAIVQDLLTQDVTGNLQTAIQDLCDGRDILRAVASESQRLTPFDLFAVTLYSVDGKHARDFYHTPEDIIPQTVRWRPMSRYAQEFVKKRAVTIIRDFDEWFRRPEWRRYRNDPDMQAFLALGFRSSISFPVIIENRVEATVSFSRTQQHEPFTEADSQRLAALPLGAAVRMVLHHDSDAELRFALRLLRRIASPPSGIELIAQRLVDELQEHYGWEHISIFRPSEDQKQLCLVKQAAPSSDFCLPHDWCHPVAESATGQVYTTGKPLNIPDTTEVDSGVRYLSLFERSRSELCLPIFVEDRVFWVCNVEDSMKNAFVREEQETLERILAEVSILVELFSKTQLFSELLLVSGDAVVQTDPAGVIKQVNPAAERLLQYSAEEFANTPLHRYFVDGEIGSLVERSEFVPNQEYKLRRKDGSELAMLVSGASLPPELGRKVYVFNDLSGQKQFETLEILRHLYNEIASQIKTPLSLTFTWLDKLKEMHPEIADVLEKTLKQLNKVDLTYDRLLFYERHENIAPLQKNLLRLSTLVEGVLRQIPDREVRLVNMKVAPDVPRVNADLFQVSFCIESIIAYLLRFVPEDGSIDVDIERRDGSAAIVIRGYAPAVTGGEIQDYTGQYWAIRAITELSLGRDLIRGFIVRNHDGTFSENDLPDGRTEYLVELPAA